MARDTYDAIVPLPLGEPRDEFYPLSDRDTDCPCCYRRQALTLCGRHPGAEVYCNGCMTQFRVREQLFGLVLERQFATLPEPRRCVDCGTRSAGYERCTPCSIAFTSQQQLARAA